MISRSKKGALYYTTRGIIPASQSSEKECVDRTRYTMYMPLQDGGGRQAGGKGGIGEVEKKVLPANEKFECEGASAGKRAGQIGLPQEDRQTYRYYWILRIARL